MRKYILTFAIFVQAILLTIGVSVLSLKDTGKVFADVLGEQAEEVTAPTSLEELQNASSEQFDAWAKLSCFDGRDYDYITPARQQGEQEICWAYAAVGAVEASILREGIDEEATKENLDLDEVVTAYTRFNNDGEHDPLMLTTNDTYSGNWNQGGIVGDAIMATTRGYSLVDQQTSYRVNEDELKKMVAPSKYFVQNAIVVANNVESIKQAILRYGAVTIGYHAYLGGSGNYVYYEDYSKNHSSIIVGWDDSIPNDSKFKPNTPSKPGAWIVKNSWGDYGFNNKGVYCYYLSYESKLQDLWAVDLALKKDYQNLYYYDGNGLTAGTYVAEMQGAIFEAKLSSSTQQEQLKAVVVNIDNNNSNVNVKVYRHLNVNPGNVNDAINCPVQHEPVASKDVYIERSGMFTIDLDQPVDLDQGEYFSVVISGTNKYNSPIMIPTAVDYSLNDMTYYCYNGVWRSYKGASDIYAENSTEHKTLKIRAVTNTKPRENNLGNDLQYARVEIANRFLPYVKGEAQIPEIKVYFGEELLTETQDYKVKIDNNFVPGIATINIEGINSYHGTRTTTFAVAKAKYPPNKLNDTINVYRNVTRLYQIPLPKDWQWTSDDCDLDFGGSGQKYLKYTGDDAEFYQNITCKIVVNRLDEDIPNKIDITGESVEVVGQYFYTGEKIIPVVKVVCQGLVLNQDWDYTLSCQNNINAGNATVIIHGINNYTGTIELPFVIQKSKDVNIDTVLHIKQKFKSLSEVKLPEGFVWDEKSEESIVVVSENVIKATASYIGENYDIESLEFTIIVVRPSSNFVIYLAILTPVGVAGFAGAAFGTIAIRKRKKASKND